MNKDIDTITILKKLDLFKSLKKDQLAQIVTISQQVQFYPGDFIIHEGEKSEAFYVLLEGSVELVQKNTENQTYHPLATLKPHDYFSEIALIENACNINSARALSPVTLLLIKVKPFHDLTEKMQVNRNIMQHVSGKLYDHINGMQGFALKNQLEKTQHTRLKVFLISIIFILCFYAFVLKFSSIILATAPANTIITTGMLFIYLFSALIGAKILRYPPRFYGLTLTNWRQSALESLLFSLPIFLGVVAVKWFLINFSSAYQGVHLFNPYGVIRNHALPELGLFSSWLIMCVFYMLHAPIQEFLVRGILQSLMQEFFTSRYRILNAILCSNIIFATFHVFIATKFAFFIFLPGLFWGWLYARQKTLVGPMLSHVLLGLWAIFIVGFSKPF